MVNYLRNIFLWMRGFTRFDELTFKEGWHARQLRWWLLYLIDHGACVILLGGAVETVSSYAHRHRSGKAWDFLLDLIEKCDPGHGVNAGPPLWESVECGKIFRLFCPILWLFGLAVIVLP